MPNAENLQARISEALENELAKIYDEMGIKTGDIHPEQALKWDELTADMAQLFQILINQNQKG